MTSNVIADALELIRKAQALNSKPEIARQSEAHIKERRKNIEAMMAAERRRVLRERAKKDAANSTTAYRRK